MVDSNTTAAATLSAQGPVDTWADVVLDGPALGCEAWREALRPAWGRYDPKDVESRNFIGTMIPQRVCGIVGMHLGCTGHRVERTQRDARLDGIDHYTALFLVAGGTTMIQNEQAVELTTGDTVLVDSGRPITYVCKNDYTHCFVLQLPRRALVSHLGFEPKYAQGNRRNARAGRLLFQLVRDAVENGDLESAATNYMRLAIFDLVGAQFSAPDSISISLNSDKLYTRLCNIIKDRFADSSLTPSEVAAEAGISLRYLQKLFTMRNMTCTQFINFLRLDYAASLLQRRTALKGVQPISEIAYASGFGDYSYFARLFCSRFGHPPGAHGRLAVADETSLSKP
jgi:AraC family transcriptional activator of tynA and feaB